MKIALLFLLTVVCHNGFANEIDQLSNRKEVLEFVKRVNPAFANAKFQIRPTELIAKDLECGGIFKDWNIQNWEKADLNNDGLTDLLFVAYWSGYKTYAMTDQGKGAYKVHEIFRGNSEECELAKPFRMSGKTYLKIYRKSLEMVSLSEDREVILVDTLTFQYDDLLELRDRPENYKIESIRMEHSCSEFCPVFSFVIDRNGETEYTGKSYFVKGEFKKERTFKKKLPRNTFNELAEILSYIRVKELKDRYVVPWFHASTAILTVTFTNGEVKKIGDYGMHGTYGLKAVYDRLTKLALDTE